MARLRLARVDLPRRRIGWELRLGPGIPYTTLSLQQRAVVSLFLTDGRFACAQTPEPVVILVQRRITLDIYVRDEHRTVRVFTRKIRDRIRITNTIPNRLVTFEACAHQQ